MKLGLEPTIHPGAQALNSRLGRYTEIGAGARLVNVTLGDYSYTDRFADLANAEIGKFVNIASFTRVNPGDHPMERASQHHFLYRSAMYFDDEPDAVDIFERRASKPVVIGHDAWLGHGAIILAGRRLGVGSVLGAGSVLTKDAGDYEIWAGAPARKIKDRFDPIVKAQLLDLAYWDWSHDKLRRALPDLRALGAAAFAEKWRGRP